MQVNVKQVKAKDNGFIPWFSSSLRLAYVHVVEVSHKGFEISFNPLLPHTYR
jgi:hypothetical protein